MAKYCKAFRCLPSQLRAESPEDLEYVAHGIFKIEEEMDTLRQVLKK